MRRGVRDWADVISDYNIAIVPGLLGLGVLAWFTTGRKSYILNRDIE